MTKKVLTIISLLFLIWTIPNQSVGAQGSTDSAEIDDPSLTQSIKDRIKKIATQSSSVITPKKKIAFLGSVEKIASETLTIKTQEDIKLASLSAQTTYSRLPQNSSVKREDISIGDYAVAMGFINGSEVLETKRILLFSEPPPVTKKVSSAGILTLVDLKQQIIEFRSDDTAITLELTKNTDLAIQSGVEKTPLELDQLTAGQYLVAIYIPTNDQYTTPKALTILATSIFKPVTGVATASADLASPPPTDGSPTPPELSR